MKILVNPYDGEAHAYENAGGELAVLERDREIVGTGVRYQQRRKQVSAWFLAVADEWIKAMYLPGVQRLVDVSALHSMAISAKSNSG